MRFLTGYRMTVMIFGTGSAENKKEY
jgi:hypothetical protein